MWRSPESRFDAATGTSIGARDSQEDSVLIDFPVGSDAGILVLADGMGGHEAGEVASGIAVVEGLAVLRRGGPWEVETRIPARLAGAVRSANEGIRHHADSQPETEGMGTTMVAAALVGDKLFWASVGDSSLLLVRNGAVRRLNVDHSLGPQIDMMVRQGQLTAEAARDHPDRHVLTSVVMGRAIRERDVPDVPVKLRRGDVVIAASDGLDTLDHRRIARIASRNRRRGAKAVVAALLDAVSKAHEPEQDNVSLAVVTVTHTGPLTVRAGIRRAAAGSRAVEGSPPPRLAARGMIGRRA